MFHTSNTFFHPSYFNVYNCSLPFFFICKKFSCKRNFEDILNNENSCCCKPVLFGIFPSSITNTLYLLQSDRLWKQNFSLRLLCPTSHKRLVLFWYHSMVRYSFGFFLFPLEEQYLLSSLVEIDLVVLRKKLKLWKIADRWTNW
jgi:hypothetical protein